MDMRSRPLLKVVAALAVAGCSVGWTSGPLRAADDLAARASWSQPTTAQIREQLQAWLQQQDLDEVTKLKVEALWSGLGDGEAAPSQSELLDRLGTTLALVDERARAVVQQVRADAAAGLAPEFEFLSDESLAPLVRHNLRLLYAQWLSQQRLFDESTALLEGLRAEDVVDPAALLFYQSVGLHRKLDKKACLPMLAKLLENEAQLPERYRTLAKLMQADLTPLKPDSLDEVARLMDDINRRLDLGRAGTVVRKQEDDVIAKLDKLIEEAEKKSGGGGGGGTGAGGIQSSAPAGDSAPLGGTGPGNVDPKNIGNKSDWGNLPPKERQEALQQISKELPAHYREVIEEYFRKLARDLGD